MKTLIFIFAMTFATTSKSAVHFDGSNDYIEITNEQNFDFAYGSSFTISGWFYFNSFAGYGTLIAKMQDSPPYTGWELLQDASTGKIYFDLISSFPDTTMRVLTDAGFPLSTWAHLAATYDGSGAASGMKVYFNGVSQAYSIGNDSLGTADATNNTNVTIGSRAGGTTPFPGQIDDLRIYNRVLSENEIKSLALSRNRLANTGGLISHWRLDEGIVNTSNGTDARDSSGNKNHGTLTNGPIWKGSPFLTYP